MVAVALTAFPYYCRAVEAARGRPRLCSSQLIASFCPRLLVAVVPVVEAVVEAVAGAADVVVVMEVVAVLRVPTATLL